MKIGYAKSLVACLLIITVPAVVAKEGEKPAAPCEEAASALPTVELTDLLESVSKKSKKKFLVDSRVRPDVVVGQFKSSDVSYPILHSILRNNNLAAVTVQGIVNIVPVAVIRQYPLPVLYEDDSTIADDEWVTRIVRPKRVRATMLVPVLRPLLPQQGHLTGVPQSNTLTIVARYANAKRIAEMVQDMDEHTPESEDKVATETREDGRKKFEADHARRQTLYLADVIRATAYTINDQLQGYLLWPGADKEKFAALGLRTCDLLRDIDGTALTDPQSAKQLFGGLGATDHVSVTVRQNGEHEVIELDTSLLSQSDDP